MALLEVTAKLTAKADDMVNGFRRAQNAAGAFGSTVNQTAGVAQRGFGLITKLAMAGGVAMQGAAVAGATMGVKFAMANEQAIISFKTLLGSQTAAEKMFKDLQGFAAKTPFEFPQLRDAASKLLTTGVAAEKVLPMMTAIGDSTAAMGTGAEGIQRAVYALQQMNLVGAVKGQDMMQLANAGIPAWDALAAAAGKSVQEVKKQVEKGQLQNSVQLLMKGIENYQGAAMGRVKGMMVEQSTTLMGLMSTLKDNINIALGDMMKPATKAIKDALPAINDAVGKTMKSMTVPVTQMVETIMVAFQQLVPAIEPMMMALSTIMVAAIKTIVPVVAQIATVLPSLQPALEGIAQMLADIGSIVGPVVTELAVGFVPIVTTMVEVLANATHWLAEQKGLFEALMPVLGALTAGYVALKVSNAAMNWGRQIVQIAKMIGGTLGLTASVSTQAAATAAATTAQHALAVAQAEALVTAGGGAAATAAYDAALAAQAAAASAATTAQWGLNTAMLANPITWVIAAIAALVVGFILLWNKFEGFRVFWVKVWNGIVDGTQWAVQKLIDYFLGWVNLAIDGVNLFIKAWNAIPFHKDVEELKHLNYQLDLSAAKIDPLTVKTKTVAQNFKTAAQYAKQTYDYNNKYEKADAEAARRKRKAAYDAKNNPSTTTTGGGSKTNPLQKMIDATKQFGKDALTKAQNYFKTLADRAADFASSIRNAIMDVYSFSNALNKSLATKKSYEDATKRVADAEQAVNEALKNRDMGAYAKAIQEYSDAMDNLTTASEGQMTFMQALESQYKAAVEFSDLIGQLRTAGVNEAGIRQIVGAGAEAGGQMAKEILAGGQAAVSQVNTWYDALSKVAKDAGDQAKDQFYKQGLTQGEALVKGIEDATKKLNLRLSSKGLSKTQIEQLQKNFGVDIGFTMTSLANLATPMANGGIVRARNGGTLALLGEAGRDEAVIPLSRGGSNATAGNTYEINIQAGVGDPQEIGRQVVQYLQAYEKRSGPIPVSVR